jgi:hypothetical protein
MNRNVKGSPWAAPTDDRWAQIMEDDVTGIDGDIEMLIGLYQDKYGYSRNKANAELVRRLSSLAGSDVAVSGASRCSGPLLHQQPALQVMRRAVDRARLTAAARTPHSAAPPHRARPAGLTMLEGQRAEPSSAARHGLCC